MGVYARLERNAVINIEVHDAPTDKALVPIDNLDPRPAIGWRRTKNGWTPPKDEGDVIDEIRARLSAFLDDPTQADTTDVLVDLVALVLGPA